MGPGEDSYRRYLDGDETAFDGVIAASASAAVFEFSHFHQEKKAEKEGQQQIAYKGADDTYHIEKEGKHPA